MKNETDNDDGYIHVEDLGKKDSKETAKPKKKKSAYDSMYDFFHEAGKRSLIKQGGSKE